MKLFKSRLSKNKFIIFCKDMCPAKNPFCLASDQFSNWSRSKAAGKMAQNSNFVSFFRTFLFVKKGRWPFLTN